jgi:hypothetical protein
MDAPASQGSRIEDFLELCSLCRNFNRPLFLREIVEFVGSASDKELADLRESIAQRARSLKANRGMRGRPRGRSDKNWLKHAKDVAWQRHVKKWTWRKIAEVEGLKPTKENYRTLERRRNSYAAVVWETIFETLGGGDPSPERIKQALESVRMRQSLVSRVGIPFRDAPTECTDFALALVPFGRKTSHEEVYRQFNHLIENRTKKAPESSVKKPL